MSAINIFMRLSHSCEVFMLSISNIALEAKRLFTCFEIYWCVLHVYEPLGTSASWPSMYRLPKVPNNFICIHGHEHILS